jgi:hypothetical protein
MTDTVPELTGYQATAAELRRIADAIEKLPSPREQPYVTLSILPSRSGSPDEQKVADVDAVAWAVLDCASAPEQIGDDWFQLSRGNRAGVYFAVQAQLAKKPDPRDVELARLRARVAELEAFDAHGFSREADDPTPASPARVQPHTGGFRSSILADGTRKGEPVQLIDELEELTPASAVEHGKATVRKGGDRRSCGVTCLCGAAFTGFDTLAEAVVQFNRHIDTSAAHEPPPKSR